MACEETQVPRGPRPCSCGWLVISSVGPCLLHWCFHSKSSFYFPNACLTVELVCSNSAALVEVGTGPLSPRGTLIPRMVCLNGSFWGTPGRNARHWFPEKVGKSNSSEWKTKERDKFHIILNFARLVFSLYNSLQEELLGIISGYFLKFLHERIIATHSVSSPRASLVIQIHFSSSVCVAFFLCTVFSKYTLGKKWNSIWKFNYLEKFSKVDKIIVGLNFRRALRDHPVTSWF